MERRWGGVCVILWNGHLNITSHIIDMHAYVEIWFARAHKLFSIDFYVAHYYVHNLPSAAAKASNYQNNKIH